MPTIFQRLASAYDGWKRVGGMGTASSGRIRDGDDIAMVTARPSDLLAGTRYQQIKFAEFITKHSKWVRVAVSRNASAVAAVPIRVFRVAPKTGGVLRSHKVDGVTYKRLRTDSGSFARKSFGNYREGWEEITDERHPLVQLLGQANNQINGYELVEQTQQFLELTGNGYWFKENGTQRYPKALHVLFPQFCEVVPNEDGSIGHYNYGRPGTVRTIRPEECVHFKFPNPSDVYYGLAPLAACFDEADISAKLTQFATAFLDYGVVGGANVFLPNATKDQTEEIRVEYEGLYSGPRKANRTRFWRGRDVRVEYPPQLDKNPILAESENMARNIIAAAFDLPVGLLNMEEKSLANGKVVAPHWQMLAIKPRCQRMEDKINENLVPDFREALRDPTLIVCFDNPVAEDRAALVVEVTTLAGNKPLITQDEARGQLRLPPLTPEQREELEPPEPVAGPGDKEGPSDSQRKALWHGDGHDHEIAVKQIPTTVVLDIAKLSLALARIFRSFAPAYAANPSSPGLGVSVRVRASMVEQVRDAAEPTINATYMGGFNAGAEQINAAGVRQRLGLEPMDRMESLTLEAQEWLRTYTLDLASEVTQTYEGRIRAILQTTVAEGGSIGDASQRIRMLVPDEAPYSAARIARTETMRAYARGTDAAAQKSGIVTMREWLPSGDPCKVCEEIYEKYRYAKPGDPFVKKGTVVAGRAMDYGDGVFGSDAHPNCVLPDTVVSTDGLAAAFRSRYAGPVVSIRTSSGRVVTVTENHQLLTSRGFVRAASLAVGGNLLCCSSGQHASSNPNHHNRPTTAVEVFETLRKSGVVSTASVPAASKHLHGDGANCVGEIDVVAAHSLLRHGFNAELAEHLLKHPLMLSDVAAASGFDVGGDSTAMFLALRLAANGCVGCSQVAKSLANGDAGVSELAGLAYAAWGDPGAEQSGTDDIARNAEVLGDLVLRPEFDGVETDNIAEINVGRYVGHVYDLSTLSGVYTCNSIIGHNCSCGVGMVYVNEIERARE